MAKKKKKRRAKSRKFVLVKSLFLGLLIVTLEILSKDSNVSGDPFLQSVLLLF